MRARTAAGMALAATLAAHAAPAPAHEEAGTALLRASDLDALLAIARAYGEAEIVEHDGERFIEGTLNDVAYGIMFYDCEDLGGCGSLQFYAGWTDAEVPSHTVNVWNRDYRYGRAYTDREGNTVIEMDVNMAYGVPIATYADSFDTWSALVTAFRDDVIGPGE